MRKQIVLKPTLFFAVGTLLLLYLLLLWITNGFAVDGWVYRMKNLLLPAAIFMLVTDGLLKYFVRSIKWIWVLETVLFLGIIYYWIVS